MNRTTITPNTPILAMLPFVLSEGTTRVVPTAMG
jgi:hypothetical protein